MTKLTLQQARNLYPSRQQAVTYTTSVEQNSEIINIKIVEFVSGSLLICVYTYENHPSKVTSENATFGLNLAERYEDADNFSIL